MKSVSKSKVRNPFVIGSVNFQKSALSRHEASKDHRLAVDIGKLRENREACEERQKVHTHIHTHLHTHTVTLKNTLSLVIAG